MKVFSVDTELHREAFAKVLIQYQFVDLKVYCIDGSYIDCLVQGCNISIAKAPEILQSCNEALIWVPCMGSMFKVCSFYLCPIPIRPLCNGITLQNGP